MHQISTRGLYAMAIERSLLSRVGKTEPLEIIATSQPTNGTSDEYYSAGENRPRELVSDLSSHRAYGCGRRPLTSEWPGLLRPREKKSTPEHRARQRANLTELQCILGYSTYLWPHATGY